DARPAGLLGEPFRKVERRGPADVLSQIIVELPLELWILTGMLVLFRELPQGVHQGFGDIASAIRTKSSLGIGNGLTDHCHGTFVSKGVESTFRVEARRR